MARTARHKSPSRPAADDYRAKTARETTREANRGSHHAGHPGLPEPFGDPSSGVVLVAGPSAAGARAANALRLSLAAVRLESAYVVWPSSGLLTTLLSAEPSVLVAVGPDAASAIDAAGYPLARSPFSDAPEGTWFAWTKSVSGLRRPALAPAPADPDPQRRFWRAFLALRVLAPGENTLEA